MREQIETNNKSVAKSVVRWLIFLVLLASLIGGIVSVYTNNSLQKKATGYCTALGYDDGNIKWHGFKGFSTFDLYCIDNDFQGQGIPPTK